MDMDGHYIGAKIEFYESGVKGVGIIEGLNPAYPNAFAVRVLHSNYRGNFHNCNGFFKRPVGWNVWAENITGILEYADEANEMVDINSAFLLEVLNG